MHQATAFSKVIRPVGQWLLANERHGCFDFGEPVEVVTVG